MGAQYTENERMVGPFTPLASDSRLMANKQLLEGIASKIADYRKGEITAPDADHVIQWVSQFDSDVQDLILKEMDHVLQRTYVTRKDVNRFLKEISGHEKLTNGKPKKFWKETTVLNIQKAGSSQREMLQLLREIVEKEHGVKIDASPEDSSVAVYIDDVVFSGGHVRGDLVKWIQEKSPRDVLVHVLVLAFHSGGQWYASQEITKAAKSVGKSVNLMWWRMQEFEEEVLYKRE